MTYHDYAYNPDANVHEVALLRAALDKYAPDMPLRQGENGAPSNGGAGGALWDNPWTELTQAKWKARRMLGNLGQDIESSVFGLVEMSYTSGPINRMVTKGILKSDASKRVIRPKIAYYAIQNITSIFDNSLERIRALHHSHDAANGTLEAPVYSHSTDRRVAGFGYRNKTSGKTLYTFWLTENIPIDANELRLQTISISHANIDQPVWVDLISGAVHEIPASQWKKEGAIMRLTGIPFYDAPIVIADKSLVSIAA